MTDLPKRIQMFVFTVRYAAPESVDDYIIRTWRPTELEMIQFAEKHFKKSWGKLIEEGWRIQPISITFNPNKIHVIDKRKEIQKKKST